MRSQRHDRVYRVACSCADEKQFHLICHLLNNWPQIHQPFCFGPEGGFEFNRRLCLLFTDGGEYDKGQSGAEKKRSGKWGWGGMSYKKKHCEWMGDVGNGGRVSEWWWCWVMKYSVRVCLWLLPSFSFDISGWQFYLLGSLWFKELICSCSSFAH